MTDFRLYSTLILDGKLLSKNELISLSNEVLHSQKEDWEKDIFSFILEWLNDTDFITAFTSGSTGKPKEIKLRKSALIFSAKNTLNFLDIDKKDTAFLCIPVKYIGGKMMLIRSFIGELNLSYTKPSSDPFSELKKKMSFAAITPFQASKSSSKNLKEIEKIIIGGGNVNVLLSSKLKIINSSFYSTYGMTETCSHIALKNISDGNDYFEVLDDISISKDDRSCLLIDSPELSSETIKTNDVIELITNSKFIWKGRFDNVINSGGVKLCPEEIETKLSGHISDRFFITKETDNLLGEKLVLIVESEEEYDLNLPSDLLSKYEVPKHIYFIPKFVETESGKIQREKTFRQ